MFSFQIKEKKRVLEFNLLMILENFEYFFYSIFNFNYYFPSFDLNLIYFFVVVVVVT